MSALSMRTWSALAGTGRTVLLIHGNREVAETWWKVADLLVKDGYNVHAPELLNMGFSPLTRPEDVVPASQARFLLSHLGHNAYEAVCGVSFGVEVAKELYKLFPEERKPRRLLLLEPNMEVKFPPAMVKRIHDSANVIRTEEQIQQDNPQWSATDVAVDRLGLLRVDKTSFQWMFQGDGPELSKHDSLPDAHPSTEMIILAGDPAVRQMYSAEKFTPILKAQKPHFKLGQVKGAGHYIHKDQPQAVADALRGRWKESEAITVLID